jgi:hypothetical protein
LPTTAAASAGLLLLQLLSTPHAFIKYVTHNSLQKQ